MRVKMQLRQQRNILGLPSCRHRREVSAARLKASINSPNRHNGAALFASSTRLVVVLSISMQSLIIVSAIIMLPELAT